MGDISNIMIIRAKTKDLFESESLTIDQLKNKDLNIKEIEGQNRILKSLPRRLIFELTNSCNLNCITCGRNEANFCETFFDITWLKKFDKILNIVEEVTLMGWGEPTIHPNFKEILQYLDNYPIRKYFCTNGMLLDKLFDDIFTYKVDIIAISLDGAFKETSEKIRRGSDFNHVINTLKRIVHEKKRRGISYPYMNFVMTVMKSNVNEVPELINLAHTIGLEEVKVVYFTAFSEKLRNESLYQFSKQVQEIFNQAEKIANNYNIILKLPYIEGEDPAGTLYHRPCFVAWRDFFLGSDGYVRPCMSTPIRFCNISDYNSFDDIWNSKDFQMFRETVNQEEMMPDSCKRCYQSSFANWNRKASFIQIGENFSPEWEI